MLGSSRLSNANEITYDVEEFNEDEESRDGDEDVQLLAQTIHREIGRLASRAALLKHAEGKNQQASGRNRDSEHSVDGLGDAAPHQHVGGGHAAAGAEDDAQNGTHLHHHLQQDVGPGLLQDAGAVPDAAEEAQAELPAELPQQVCVGGAAEAGGGVQDAAALLLFVLLSSLKELEQVHCKFYNELGRVLVKDFVPVQQADDLCGEADEDAPSSVPQDMGECSPPV